MIIETRQRGSELRHQGFVYRCVFQYELQYMTMIRSSIGKVSSSQQVKIRSMRLKGAVMARAAAGRECIPFSWELLPPAMATSCL